jgi:hypothetical protein
MSLFPRGYGLGNQVVKAAQGLPATTTSTLFTVSGTVLVEFMAGLVTTAIGATATTLSLGVTPTGGSAANTAISSALAITSKTVGNFFVPVFASSVGGTPVIAPAITAVPGSTTQFLVPAGVITWTTSATDTGQMAWYLSYLPVDAGATVS